MIELKVTETIQASDEEIGKAFGQMNAGAQADFLKALEVGLFKSCNGDESLIFHQYKAIAGNIKTLGVRGIGIDPEAFKA